MTYLHGAPPEITRVFALTGCWMTQSDANDSLRSNSLITRDNTGNFAFFEPSRSVRARKLQLSLRVFHTIP
jgi:hypothetical protein